MGDEVAAPEYTGEARKRYREKANRCLDVYERMLREARFDTDRRSIGFENEPNTTEETGDPAMQGEMTVTYTLADVGDGTDLVGLHEGLPPGVAPADNEVGWNMSLTKLANLVERER